MGRALYKEQVRPFILRFWWNTWTRSFSFVVTKTQGVLLVKLKFYCLVEVESCSKFDCNHVTRLKSTLIFSYTCIKFMVVYWLENDFILAPSCSISDWFGDWPASLLHIWNFQLLKDLDSYPRKDKKKTVVKPQPNNQIPVMHHPSISFSIIAAMASVIYCFTRYPGSKPGTKIKLWRKE